MVFVIPKWPFPRVAVGQSWSGPALVDQERFDYYQAQMRQHAPNHAGVCDICGEHCQYFRTAKSIVAGWPLVPSMHGMVAGAGLPLGAGDF